MASHYTSRRIEARALVLSHLLLLRLLVFVPRETLPPPLSTVTLSEPLASLNELNDVDPLLAKHDGEGDHSEDPWDRRRHLVGTIHHKSVCLLSQ
jgi:hypothetical protein